MPLFSCPDCGASLRAPDGSAGKLATCPICRSRVPIPGEVDIGPILLGSDEEWRDDSAAPTDESRTADESQRVGESQPADEARPLASSAEASGTAEPTDDDQPDVSWNEIDDADEKGTDGEGRFLPESILPQPAVPQVSVPQVSFPQPVTPQPAVSQPAFPQPAARQPEFRWPESKRPTVKQPASKRSAPKPAATTQRAAVGTTRQAARVRLGWIGAAMGCCALLLYFVLRSAGWFHGREHWQSYGIVGIVCWVVVGFVLEFFLVATSHKSPEQLAAERYGAASTDDDAAPRPDRAGRVLALGYVGLTMLMVAVMVWPGRPSPVQPDLHRPELQGMLPIPKPTLPPPTRPPANSNRNPTEAAIARLESECRVPASVPFIARSSYQYSPEKILFVEIEDNFGDRSERQAAEQRLHANGPFQTVAWSTSLGIGEAIYAPVDDFRAFGARLPGFEVVSVDPSAQRIKVRWRFGSKSGIVRTPSFQPPTNTPTINPSLPPLAIAPRLPVDDSADDAPLSEGDPIAELAALRKKYGTKKVILVVVDGMPDDAMSQSFVRRTLRGGREGFIRFPSTGGGETFVVAPVDDLSRYAGAVTFAEKQTVDESQHRVVFKLDLDRVRSAAAQERR